MNPSSIEGNSINSGADQLKEESRDISKVSKDELKHMIINFREKLKLAKNRFN